MKVILLQDVAKIGRRNEVVDVPNGYAMNQLIPSRKAEPATPANMKKISKVHADMAANASNMEAVFATAIEALSAEPLVITAEMNEQEHLFQAVNDAMVVAAAETKGIGITTAMVGFPEVVKTAGDHTVTLQHGSQSASFTISVIKKA